MSISATDLAPPRALSVRIDDDALTVQLVDGRTISAPLAWYPRLAHATPTERANWRLVGDGEGVCWPDIEEDLSLGSLIAGRRSAESASSLSRWLAGRT